MSHGVLVGDGEMMMVHYSIRCVHVVNCVAMSTKSVHVMNVTLTIGDLQQYFWRQGVTSFMGLL
jgi:hypothetical protein